MIQKAVWTLIGCDSRLGVRANVCRSINTSASAEGLLLHAILLAFDSHRGR